MYGHLGANMSRIGRAIIEVLLKSDQARSEAKSLKKDISEIGNNGSTGSKFDAFQQEMKSFGDSLRNAASESKNVGSSLGGAEGAATRLGSALGAIGLAATVFVGIHELIDMLEEAQRKAVAFKNAITTFQEVGQDRLSALRQEIEGVTELQRAKAQLAKQEQDDEIRFRADQEKRNGGPLSFAQQAAVGNAIQQRRRDAAAELDALDELYSKRSLERAQDRLAQTLAAGKDGIERLYAEQKIIDDKLDADARKANSPEEADRIAQTKRAIDAEFDARREKIRIEEADRMLEAEARKGEADAREERRQKEMAERIAQHAAAAFARETERALKDLYTGIERASAAQSSATTQALAGVTADVSRIASLIDLRLLANPIDRR